jgi:hypothetical protein
MVQLEASAGGVPWFEGFVGRSLGGFLSNAAVTQVDNDT